MAANPSFSNSAVNTEADALAALLNGGYLRVYAGAQPLNADTEIATQTLLAELRFAADAFPPAESGVITANAIASDVDAKASGTAAWFRALQRDGTTVVMDGSVGLADADCTLNSVDIEQHAEVGCTGFTLQLSKGS